MISLVGNLLKNFVRSSKGTNLIEFAFVAPVFIIIIIGTLDVGAMLVVQNALDAGARVASRFAITGETTSGGSRDDSIKQEILDTVDIYSGGIAKKKNVLIEVKAYDEIESIESPEPFDDVNSNGQYDIGEFYEDVNGNNQWDNDQGALGSFGLSGEAVKYTISYDWPSFLGLFGFKKTIHLTGTATVRNENYSE